MKEFQEKSKVLISMRNGKGIIINVGINSKDGGGFSPIWKDGTFRYIPIPGNNDELYSYRDLLLADEHIPKKLIGQKCHYDPEFETFTFGDYYKVWNSKQNYWMDNRRTFKIKQLNEGDFLFFVAFLNCEQDPISKYVIKGKAPYIIGHFEVENIFTAEEINFLYNTDTTLAKSKLLNIEKNSHLRHQKITDVEIDSEMFLVKGSMNSRLYHFALLITSELGNSALELKDLDPIPETSQAEINSRVNQLTRFSRFIDPEKIWKEMQTRNMIHREGY